ncbi:hypothetical protein [Larkinella soli]|uniref:hypothetical protein n=1 Tax=Larkinella soli TaxID=1770527 RepID=UPI000FFC94BD|nr:hypothetical protein [Larkinella soli]
MIFTKLVPSVFYTDIHDGLNLFVQCLQFSITHDELATSRPFCVLEKNGLQLYLFEDAGLAQEHHPEFRLVTEDIESVYQHIAASHPEFLHPNLPRVTLRPWGAKEFALRDNQLGIVIQQW